MQLTWRGDYTLRAAICLANSYASGAYRKIREIAEEMSIPARYTPEILNLLQRAGLAEARAGRTGGYRLSRQPAEISFLQVIEASEGSLSSERCVMSGGPCHWQGTCAAHPILEEASLTITALLRSRTLADVLEVDDKLRSKYELDNPLPDAPAN